MQIEYANHVIQNQYPIQNEPIYMALPFLKPVVKIYRKIRGNIDGEERAELVLNDQMKKIGAERS